MTVLTPGDEAELAEAVAEAAGTGTPLEIRGGGTRAGVGRPVQASRTLSTAGLSGITLYEPEALTLVVKAGTPVAEVEAALAAQGQLLPFEPMDHRALLDAQGEPTIGGVVACGVSGPRRIQAGACRDAMLGVRFVNGRGEAVKSGGRVMKNVTGYDLVKLMCGSHGTLGVLSEISFKVLPKPERAVSLVIEGLDDAAAVAVLGQAMTSPFDVTGAAHVPAGEAG
ncbi:MAG: FAD-binding protein, partial [Limibaculum sp.]